jgi:hypothetical protein
LDAAREPNQDDVLFSTLWCCSQSDSKSSTDSALWHHGVGLFDANLVQRLDLRSLSLYEVTAHGSRYDGPVYFAMVVIWSTKRFR